MKRREVEENGAKGIGEEGRIVAMEKEREEEWAGEWAGVRVCGAGRLGG